MNGCMRCLWRVFAKRVFPNDTRRLAADVVGYFRLVSADDALTRLGAPRHACYSDACFLSSATSCAVRCDALLPKRAVT
jgi:hypothetical protein